jgi:hypothetical protein
MDIAQPNPIVILLLLLLLVAGCVSTQAVGPVEVGVGPQVAIPTQPSPAP